MNKIISNKNLFLVAGIVTAFAFIGNLGEVEPHLLFGYSVNIWIVRLFWLIITVSNFTNYFEIKKAEKKSK